MSDNEISRIEHFRQFKNEIRGSDRFLIVGLDIGKKMHHAFIGTATGKTVKRGLRVENSASGFEHLLTMVQFYLDRDGFKEVVFGLEPTSVYHKPLADFLITQGHLVVYVTNEASILDGRWDKNDTKDSANAADLLAQGKCQFYDLPDIQLRDLRALLALRGRLKKQLHSSRVRIRNNLVAQYFPELDNGWNQAQEENLAIVRWCLSPHKINQLSFEDFFQMVTTRNKGLRQYERLSKIWQIAPYSIGCQPGVAIQLEAQILVENITTIQAHIASVDETIEDICLSFLEYEYLRSIPGFDPYVSAVVLAAIGTAQRFKNTHQLIKFAGLDLKAQRSGKKSHSAVPVISKKPGIYFPPRPIPTPPRRESARHPEVYSCVRRIDSPTLCKLRFS
jgi:transposase